MNPHNHSAKADYGSRRGNRQLKLTVTLMALVCYLDDTVIRHAFPLERSRTSVLFTAETQEARSGRKEFARVTNFTAMYPHKHSAKADYGSRRGNRQLKLMVTLMALVCYLDDTVIRHAFPLERSRTSVLFTAETQEARSGRKEFARVTNFTAMNPHNHSAKADYGSRRGNRQLKLTVTLMALVCYLDDTVIRHAFPLERSRTSVLFTAET